MRVIPSRHWYSGVTLVPAWALTVAEEEVELCAACPTPSGSWLPMLGTACVLEPVHGLATGHMAAARPPFGPSLLTRRAASAFGRVSTYAPSRFLALHASRPGAAGSETVNRLLAQPARGAALASSSEPRGKGFCMGFWRGGCVGLVLISRLVSAQSPDDDIDAVQP